MGGALRVNSPSWNTLASTGRSLAGQAVTRRRAGGHQLLLASTTTTLAASEVRFECY